MSYYFETVVDYDIDKAVAKIADYLKPFGFGLLTNIDVKKTLHEKIGADIRPYRILGACNPNFAREVISKESNIGLMLPCNIVVQETEDGKVKISAINPENTIKMVGNSHLNEIASRVRDVMQSLIANIGDPE